MITRAPNFPARTAIWLTPNNHNYLRITRIIKCLHRFGMQEYGRAFFQIMQNIAQNEGQGIIGEGTMRYWRAVNR